MAVKSIELARLRVRNYAKYDEGSVGSEMVASLSGEPTVEGAKLVQLMSAKDIVVSEEENTDVVANGNTIRVYRKKIEEVPTGAGGATKSSPGSVSVGGSPSDAVPQKETSHDDSGLTVPKVLKNMIDNHDNRMNAELPKLHDKTACALIVGCVALAISVIALIIAL